MASVVGFGFVLVIVRGAELAVVGFGFVVVIVVVSGLGLVEVSGFVFGFVDRCRLDLVTLLGKVMGIWLGVLD